MEHFLLNYPDHREDLNSTINVQFFNNQIRFQPRGVTIDVFHQVAEGRFRLLEAHHGYIQWIFPIREQGLNHHAAPLQRHEANTIQSYPEMQTRLVKSLKVMLHFYGMAISDTTPLITIRHPNPVICSKQYKNLCESWHNYLRITRIFKSLCELGKADYVPSILLFILAEQSEDGQLNNRELKYSMDRYWVYCMSETNAQTCVAMAIKWLREEEGEFMMDAYKSIAEKRQSDGGRWRFDPAELGLVIPQPLYLCNLRHIIFYNNNQKVFIICFNYVFKSL